MELFQTSVLNKYLKAQDAQVVKSAYEKYRKYFHNLQRQQNIRDAKEEQFQEGFLRELFVNILGYAINPEPNYNLTTEHKNETGAKKADGAILKEGKAIGVIELKGTDTKDLNRINEQAFRYKNNQTACVYVITSNYERLRFFIQDSVKYIDFNLFTLTASEFELLWLCLNANNLLNGLPLKIKEESVIQEQKITKKLYVDYAEFRSALWQNMIKNNRRESKLLLFQKTQKLLDRFIFILFAEDSGLLPPNFILTAIKRWELLKEQDNPKPLYEIFKQYFGYIDTGRDKDGIFAYNGGLFHIDTELDSIIIDDDILHKNLMVLTHYDFLTEIDVNILGHIFENSLNETENIIAELEGLEISTAKSKRKKDGVFYTPKYITKYIVENTVGRLCEEKKAEFKIIDEEFTKARKKKIIKTQKKLNDQLKLYREWLLTITICDPACGSGAFLNQALDFLIKEHRYIDELQSALLGGSIIFSEVENHILENNIYGVDINEESVEIAKLSLWLRTAQIGRKLSSLNNNIKCGNSLVDDEEFAFLKAFNWQERFPDVFLNGGFDIVIGNPPYVRADSIGNTLEFREHLSKSGKFQTLSGKWDLYIPFVELSIKIANENGKISLIIPDAYCHAEYSKKSLQWVERNKYLLMIDYYPDLMIFENVGVKSVIVNFQKNGISKFYQRTHHTITNYSEIIHKEYPESMRLDSVASNMSDNISYYSLNQICYSTKGIVGNSDEKKFQGEFEVGDLLSDIKDEIHPKLYFEGKDIGKWLLQKERWIEYGTERSPSKWSRKGFIQMFEGSKKLVAMRSPGYTPRVFLDENNGFFNESAIGFKRWVDLKGVENKSLSKAYDEDKERKLFEDISTQYTYPFLLAILNSSVIKHELNTNRRSNIHIYPEDWKALKIPVINDTNRVIVRRVEDKANQMIVKNKELQLLINGFIKLLITKFNLDKLSVKLQAWQLLDVKEFMNELKRLKINLTLLEEEKWIVYFDKRKNKAKELASDIAKCDNDIDKLVSQFYELAPE